MKKLVGTQGDLRECGDIPQILKFVNMKIRLYRYFNIILSQKKLKTFEVLQKFKKKVWESLIQSMI